MALFPSILLVLHIFYMPAQTHAAGRCGGAHKQVREAWNAHLNFREVEQVLSTAKVIDTIPMKEHLRSKGKHTSGTSEAYLLTLEGGIRAVFKPEEYLWNTHGEVATYRLSEFLDFHLVPPTVMRSLNGRTGSLQYFVETKTDLLESRKNREDVFEKVPPNQWKKANILHFLIGQWDRHAGNFLVDDAGNLVLIDNGCSSSEVRWRLGEYPWTRRGRSKTGIEGSSEFPFDNPQLIQTPTLELLHELFGGYFKEKEKLDHLFEHELPKFKDSPYPYILWRKKLWLQKRPQYGLIKVDDLSMAQTSRLRALEVSNLLSDHFDVEKIQEIEERRALLLRVPVSEP